MRAEQTLMIYSWVAAHSGQKASIGGHVELETNSQLFRSAHCCCACCVHELGPHQR